MKKQDKNTTVGQLLKMLPNQLFEELAKETNVDYSVSKLHGKTLFCLMMQSLINHGKPSQRILESLYNDSSFEPFKAPAAKGSQTRHSSISERLRNINYIFYERLMEEAFQRYSALLKKEKYNGFTLEIFDSTMIAISSNLISMGMKVGRKSSKKVDRNNFLKFTFQLTNGLPKSFKLYSDQKYIAEEAALGSTVIEAMNSSNDIMLFDRGIQSRKTYEKLTQDGRLFISRMNPYYMYNILRKRKTIKGTKSNSLILNEDLIVQLRARDHKWVETPVRLIKSTSKESGEPIFFVTNIMDELNARQITDIYRERWQIEIFFKFLKQELNINHLIGRSENAIRTVLHNTVTVAILILAFKKLNNISSFKIAKFKFKLELDFELVKEIVSITGGDIARLYSG